MFNKETKQHTEKLKLIYVSSIKNSYTKIKLHTIDINSSNYDYKEFIVKSDYRLDLNRNCNQDIEIVYKIDKNDYIVSNYKLLDKIK